MVDLRQRQIVVDVMADTEEELSSRVQRKIREMGAQGYKCTGTFKKDYGEDDAKNSRKRKCTILVFKRF